MDPRPTPAAADDLDPAGDWNRASPRVGYLAPAVEGTAASRALKMGVSYTHDAMIDQLIANPMITQNQLAAHFGYTPSWISTVMASDAFKARLEARRDQLIDPTLRMTIEERFRALAQKSLEILQKKLSEPTVSDNLALQAASLAQKALGIGQAPLQAPPAPDRLERLGGRLLALLGPRAVQASQSLDEVVVDVPSRALAPVGPAQEEL